MIGAAALSGAALAGEVAPVQEAAGVVFKAKQKETVEVRFNGRLHLQYDALDAEDNGEKVPSTNHFYFRRVYLGAKAKLSNGFYGETVLSLAGDDAPELGFDKVYIGYKAADYANLKFGYIKVPFGFEENSSSAKIPTIERSAANRFFADDIDFSARHTGIHSTGKLGAGFSYGASFVNAAQGEGSRLGGTASASNAFAGFGRLRWSNDNFTLGGDYGYQSENDVVGDKVTAWTGYANAKFAGVNLLGEYFSGDLGEEGDSQGYSLRASYRYDKWEPVVRWAYLKNDKFGIDTDELIRRAPVVGISGEDSEIKSLFVGVNYHVSKAVKLMVGYENADAENGAGDDKNEVSGVRVRAQLLW